MTSTYSIREGVTTKTKATIHTNYIIWLVIGLILLVGSTIIAHEHTLTGWQARLFYDFDNINGPGWFVTAGKWISEGLGAGYPIAVCVLVPIILKNYRLAWRFFVTIGGAGVLGDLILKYLVNEPRPIQMLHGNLHQRVIETGPGFPSGHVTVATAMALTLWFILPPKWRFVSVVWILLVAFTRLYLGVHTPMDIIGGFASGLVAVMIVRLLPEFIAKPLRLDEETA